MNYYSYYTRLIVSFLILTNCVYAQQAQVSLSRNQIVIGEQIRYTLKVKLAPNTKAFFRFPDSIAHFDIIRKGEVRGIPAENAIEQIVILTSFDSGKWFLPAIPVAIMGRVNRKISTPDSILISVGYSPDDGTGKLRDIKPVRDVVVNDYFWYYVLFGLTLLFLLIFLLVKYLSGRKKKIITAPADPYGDAMKALENLRSISLTEKEKVKLFHTALSEVFKRYLGFKTGIDENNVTTSDVLILTSGKYPVIKTDLAAVLRLNDAVKFAKYKPLEEDSIQTLEKLKELITYIEQFHNQKYNSAV